MGIFIALCVAFGLFAYLAASFVGVGSDAPAAALDASSEGSTTANARKTAQAATPALRSFLDWLLRCSPLLLALIWIAYGLLHLILPRSAALQIPCWFGALRDPAWYGSGAFEIAIGLLVVQARWRRVALLAQLLMLIALTPFVVHILAQDAALEDLLHGLPVPLGRAVLVFHNFLLFIWTLRLYRDEQARLTAARLKEQAKNTPSQAPELGGAASRRGLLAKLELQPVTIVALVMLAANAAGCWVIAVGPWQSGALYLWAMGSLATGALLGFLFGVPRWVASKGKAASEERSAYEPNTNIEKLSDWLTKMLVGVGLVELHALGPNLSRASAVLAAGLTLRENRLATPGEAQAFATGLVAYFLVAGVIQGFLLTRMFVAQAWNREAR